MTAKRFKLRLSKLGNEMITDTQKREDLYFDKEFLDATLPKATEWLNTLSEENEQLKTIINQLRTDNTKQKKLLNTAMKENEQLKIALKDKENLINICEKKFKKLGYLITCDDDGYVIE